jgi:hypothetical protein
MWSLPERYCARHFGGSDVGEASGHIVLFLVCESIPTERDHIIGAKLGSDRCGQQVAELHARFASELEDISV